MSTAANPNHSSIATSHRPPVTPGSHAEAAYTNSQHHHHHHPHDAANLAKRSSKPSKKATDPNEASKLIAAKISQLELDAAGDKEQEAEIEREVKKANRELHNLTSRMDDMQKIEILQKRVTEHLADMKRLERENIKNKKRGDMLQKEKDLARTEQSKTNTLKDKLEKLCRELQRENNRLKNENKMLQDSEKENHAIWDDKFQGLLFELQDAQDKKDHPQAQVVNIEIEELFKQRFKSLIDQYDLRELHFHSLLRSKELEVQFNIARYDKEKKAAEAEASRSRSLNAQVMTFSKTETELRSQLNIYVEKFKQVEDTLNNSNDLFLTFRKEMEEMSKKTKRLEKENSNLTRKHDLTNANILKMAEERSKTNMEMDDLRKKSEKLRSIIEQMQKQGRGLPNGMVEAAEANMQGEYAERDLEDEEESEYYDDDDAEEFDEDTEEEILNETPAQLYGPVPPPMPMSMSVNGVMAPNGIRH